jgi:hypothetical protein
MSVCCLRRSWRERSLAMMASCTLPRLACGLMKLRRLPVGPTCCRSTRSTSKTRLDVVSAHEGGAFQYELAGATCLAGDVFGVYAFDARISIGARLVIANRGAYSLFRANTFNGRNLPAIARPCAVGQAGISL